jgi:hypothetical protein
MPALEKLCKAHETVYYRPHPIESDPDVDETIKQQLHAQTLPGDIGYYELLSSDAIQTVCGISSSSLHEAPWFGKKALFLEERVKSFSRPVSLASLLNSDDLWFRGLLALGNEESPKEPFAIPPNTCRDIFGYWSYKTPFDTMEQKIREIHETTTIAKAKADEAHNALTSFSWKITEPLRRMRSLLKKS